MQDGTINYLTLSAVTDGLRFLSAYLPFLPLRLSSLMHFLTSSMAEMRHDTNGMPVVKILSKLPSRRLKLIGEQSDTGSTVSFVVLSVRHVHCAREKHTHVIRARSTANGGHAPELVHRARRHDAQHFVAYGLHVQPRGCLGAPRDPTDHG